MSTPPPGWVRIADIGRTGLTADQVLRLMEVAILEYRAYFSGPCTCPPECPNAGEQDEHGWGSCGGDLPDGSDCPCEAGWEE